MKGTAWIFLVWIFLHLQGCAAPGAGKGTAPLPNIVLILADDLGYGELGCYGQQKIETPHLDALASRGMRFTQFYAGSPVCAPSRCVLLTGRHTGHAFIRGNDEWRERGEVWNFAKAVADPNLEGQRPLPADSLTLAEVLKSRGYATGMVGKWGLGAPLSESVPNTQGFDFFYGYNCQRQAHTYYPPYLWRNREKEMLNNRLVVPGTKLPADADPLDPASYRDFILSDYAPDRMHQEALQFMENNKDRPFFLYYASPIPHLPLQAPARWVDHYRKKFGPETPYLGEQGYFPNLTPKATYAAMISYLDEEVGSLVAKLRALGLEKNTLILFTSDNGPSYTGGVDAPFFESAGPFRCTYEWGKGFLREGGIRVPFLAVWPGQVPAGTATDHLAGFWDVLPTIAALTGAAPPANDGQSFLPTLRGQQQKQPDFLYWEFPEYKGQQALRMGPWKAYRRNMQDGELQTMLYNLELDPREEKDLAAENPDVLARAEAIMQREHQKSAVRRFWIKALDGE